MAAQGFPRNFITVTVDSGNIYTSVFFPKPSSSSKPTIIFLHGFPSSSYDWHNQITYFCRSGYGVVAPDLLGYGGTSAPLAPESYTFKNMAKDIISLLQHCDIDLDAGDKLHVVGHDFGSIFIAGLLGYYPNLALTASFLAVPYTPPGVKLNLGAMKAITERILGFELFGYRRFLMRADSWRIIGEHKEPFFTLLYGPEKLMMSDFLPAGKLEAWLISNKQAPHQPWVTPQYKETRDKIFATQDAYKGPTDWYRARFREFLGIEEEARELGQPKIPCPAMFMQSKGSTMLMEEVKTRTGRFADVYEYKEAEHGEGHFVQLEAPDDVNKGLEEFFEKYEKGSNTKL